MMAMRISPFEPITLRLMFGCQPGAGGLEAPANAQPATVLLPMIKRLRLFDMMPPNQLVNIDC
jgi:hypothetical protein